MAQTISLAYQTALEGLSRSSRGYIVNVNLGETITADTYLKSFKIYSLFQKETSLFGNSVARYVEIELIADDRAYDNWLDTQIEVYLGIEVSPGTYEYLKQGLFRVREMNYDKDQYLYKLMAYDGMVRLNKPYPQPDVSEFPRTLASLASDVVAEVGLELDSTIFPNSTFSTEAPNVGENEYTYRNIIQWIAELSGTNAIMTKDGKLKFAEYKRSGAWDIGPEDYYKLVAEPQFGPITAVQMTRDALGDIVTFPVIDNGDIVYNIIDNMVAYNQREDIIEDIHAIVEGIAYTPYTLTWDGTYHLELGDLLRITDNNSNQFYTYYTNSVITYNGAVSEELFMRAYTPETSAIKTPGAIAKKGTFTEARVNKLDNQITLLASEVGDLGQNYSQLVLNIGAITATVQEVESELGTLQSQITQNATDVQIAFDQNTEMKQYYNFNSTELSIGRPANPGIIKIGFPGNIPQISLTDGSNETAIIKSDNISISNAQIRTSLSTAKHKIEVITIGGTDYTVFLPQG